MRIDDAFSICLSLTTSHCGPQSGGFKPDLVSHDPKAEAANLRDASGPRTAAVALSALLALSRHCLPTVQSGETSLQCQSFIDQSG